MFSENAHTKEAIKILIFLSLIKSENDFFYKFAKQEKAVSR